MNTPAPAQVKPAPAPNPPAQGRGPGTDEGAPIPANQTPTQRKYTGRGEPSNLAGPIREWSDLAENEIAAFAEQGGTVAVSKEQADGSAARVGSYAAGEIDLDKIGQAFGPGVYRLRVSVPGTMEGPGRRFRVAVAAGVTGSYTGQTYTPPPPPPAPPAYAPAPAYPPAPVYSPPPVTTQPIDLTAVIVTMMQNQQGMLTAMLQERTRPAELGQVETLLKLADRLASKQGGGDELGIAGIADAVARVLPAMQAQRAPAPERRRLLRVRPTAPQAAAPTTYATTPGTVTTSSPAGSVAVSAGDGSTQSPIGSPLAALDGWAAMVQRSANKPERRAEDYAGTLADILDDEQAEQLLSAPLGVPASVMIRQFPALETQAAFLLEVEKAFRDLLTAPADDDIDDNQDEPAPIKTPAAKPEKGTL